VTALGQVLIATSVLACGIIYGTDVLSAIVLRPALALAGDQTLVSIRGRVHDFGDRRLRVPGVAGLVAATLETAAIAWGRAPGRDCRWRHRGGRIGVLAHHLRSDQRADQLPPSGHAKAACVPPASCERLF